MKTNSAVWIAIAGTICFSLITLTAYYAQTKNSNTSAATTRQERDALKKVLKSTFPKVAYDQDNPSDESTIEKRSKYDQIKVLDPDVTEDSESISSIDWESGLPALPVKQSEIVLTGNVSSARAYLSANKSSVFSEFQIEVSEVFKNRTTRKLNRGDALFVEREGGIVKFANGSESWFRLSGQKMPEVGKGYLFFVSHEFPWIGKKSELYLITAYGIENDNVVPLDFPAGGTHPIAETYKGRKQSVLLTDLLKAVKESRPVVSGANL